MFSTVEIIIIEKSMRKIFRASLFSLVSFFVLATPAFAHVVVKPAEVATATFQTFTMGVPNEKDNPTVAVRLIIPDGLKYVSPNVKPGWTITIKKDGSDENAKVTEIDWTGGSIPVGQRDDFYFNAQVPSKETTLKWNVYQVYENGETVAWTQEPNKNSDDDLAPPHSTTKVVNDINSASSQPAATEDKSTYDWLSITAIALATVSIIMQFSKKK